MRDLQRYVRSRPAMGRVQSGVVGGLFVLSLMLSPVAASNATSQDAAPAQQRITMQEVLSGDPIPADHRVAYGDHEMQFGDLRLPDTPGPWPVAILIHGGCWLDIATLQYFDRVAEAITDLGIATWNIEYRPVDVEGGGWPNTFLDVAHGVDKVRDLAREHNLDLDRVITLGHSAGGHLALWAAGRPRIYDDSDIYTSDPLPISAAISLGGVPELRRFRLLDPNPCGDAVDRLMGGGPREVPERYLAGSPFQMLPLNVPQRHITGRDDRIVPPRQVSAYNYEAQAADDSEMIIVPDAGHWEVVWPGTPAWDQVEATVLSLIGVR
ncbi:MAG: alpha/beta hydrolase [Acidobacteria bacterium]|nr:alpha/beta hydrolase [Acidobacteriota bacterium]